MRSSWRRYALTPIRRNRPDMVRPFQMPIYPLTGIVAFGGWLDILVASGIPYILAGCALLAFGVLPYLWRARRAGDVPFSLKEANR